MIAKFALPWTSPLLMSSPSWIKNSKLWQASPILDSLLGSGDSPMPTTSKLCFRPNCQRNSRL
jgi:hypothetical protein